MIKLDVAKYCHNCDEFEPVCERDITRCDNFFVIGEGEVNVDTVIKCEHRYRCEAMYNHIQKEVNK